MNDRANDANARLQEVATELGEVRTELPVASYRREHVTRILDRLSEELAAIAQLVRQGNG